MALGAIVHLPHLPGRTDVHIQLVPADIDPDVALAHANLLCVQSCVYSPHRAPSCAMRARGTINCSGSLLGQDGTALLCGTMRSTVNKYVVGFSATSAVSDGWCGIGDEHLRGVGDRGGSGAPPRGGRPFRPVPLVLCDPRPRYLAGRAGERPLWVRADPAQGPAGPPGSVRGGGTRHAGADGAP
ncbi:MAG: hypothetical protein DDT40_00917 [candidate division WS2 bacterium]|nr:hypothetical protein [Candidatus Psychracetigena formicireducens]